MYTCLIASALWRVRLVNAKQDGLTKVKRQLKLLLDRCFAVPVCASFQQQYNLDALSVDLQFQEVYFFSHCKAPHLPSARRRSSFSLSRHHVSCFFHLTFGAAIRAAAAASTSPVYTTSCIMGFDSAAFRVLISFFSVFFKILVLLLRRCQYCKSEH